MPPKKRAKPTTAATPHASTPGKTPTKELPLSGTPLNVPDVLNDPWTDDQETSLFKNMIRWKPTGLHKHVHMIQIASSMSREGFSYQTGVGYAPHTRIPGIWKKLSELYDLEALDERENAHALAGWPDVADRIFVSPDKRKGDTDDADAEDEDAQGEDAEDDELDQGPWFQLPEDEFAQAMWDRRLAAPGPGAAPSTAGDVETEGGDGSERNMRGRRRSPRVVIGAPSRSESPPACPELLPKPGDPAPVTADQDGAAGDQADTDDARSHAATPPGSTRAKGAGGAKGSIRATAAARSRGNRAAGKNTKAQSAEPEEEEDDEEEEESSSEEEDEGETPPAKDGGRSGRSGRRAAPRGGNKRTSGRKR